MDTQTSNICRMLCQISFLVPCVCSKLKNKTRLFVLELSWFVNVIHGLTPKRIGWEWIDFNIFKYNTIDTKRLFSIFSTLFFFAEFEVYRSSALTIYKSLNRYDTRQWESVIVLIGLFIYKGLMRWYLLLGTHNGIKINTIWQESWLLWTSKGGAKA